MIGKDRTKCYYCERHLKMPDAIRKDPLFRTRDHVVPQCRGGKGNPENIVFCCAQCNTNKGGKSLWQWECFLSSRFIQKKTTSTWRPLIPLIIQNIRKHPLYNKEHDTTSFRQFNKPTTIYRETLTVDWKYLYPDAPVDETNFHEDYPPNKQTAQFLQYIPQNQS